MHIAFGPNRGNRHVGRKESELHTLQLETAALTHLELAGLYSHRKQKEPWRLLNRGRTNSSTSLKIRTAVCLVTPVPEPCCRPRPGSSHVDPDAAGAGGAAQAAGGGGGL